MNDANDFARIEDVFERAVPLAGFERQALLDETLHDRADLRAEVEALLAAHDVMPPVEPDLPRSSLGVGSRVGPYRLAEKLGEGGMGEVFRAERVEGGFDQQAAIKVTRAVLHRVDLARRFWLERQILASLAHPNIVAMLDGGATDEGQAYFVMEYVAGQPITHYCRERSLPLAQRLELVRTICGGVQYAHQRGIVHRDLKPANILVQADGVPKVLDFGVAKVLHGPTDEGATRTSLLPGPLTPNYASPEQLRGLSATTASDVYALGVLLYELTTGIRPYNTEGLTLDRVIDIVLHQEPPRPSAAASTGVPYPLSLLRGDLDAIIAKAMHKEQGERYDSAGQLAADLTRMLNREPVMARPASAAYVLRRMAARHKAAVAVGVLAIVAVVAASATAFWQRQVARREQARAELLFRDGRQLANALIFKVHDAVAKLPGSTEVRKTIVQDAVAYLERLEPQSGGDPAMRLELAGAFSQIASILGDPQQANLGDRDGAVRQYERARSLSRALLSPTAPFEAVEVYVRAGQRLVSLTTLKGDRDQAILIARDAVDHASRYAEDHPDDARGPKLLAESDFYLAWSLGVNADSVPVWERAMAYYDGQLAREPESYAHRRNASLMRKYLSSTLTSLGRRSEAGQHHHRALELDELRLAAAPDNRQARLDAAISNGQMGEFLEQGGQLSAAAERYERGLTLRREAAQADPKDVLARERLAYGLMSLGLLRHKLGAPTVAHALLREAITLQDGVLQVTGDLPARERLAKLWHEVGTIEEEAEQAMAACQAYRRAKEMFAAAQPLSDKSNKVRFADAEKRLAKCASLTVASSR
jgi:non-specific serine/threonine protein kinase/serine/threonine-protein kinase